jgi:hypothetical protein
MAIILVAMSFYWEKNEKGTLVLQLNHYVGDQILKLDSIIYKNELGQSFTVTNFKYYISNLHIKNNKGKEFRCDESFLINEDDEKTKQIILKNIPQDTYTSVEFIIGVDSLHNCNGAQSGALDPIHAMFWAWNTGYIFLKLEGKSPQSKSPGHYFEFHIGGYRLPNNCIRKVTLDLSNKNIVVVPKKLTYLKLKADLKQVFESPTPIDLEKLSSVTDFHNATTIADNYKDMFSLIYEN